MSAGTDNVAAFEFTLKDGTTAVELKAITAKVKAMVRYTSNLATVPFDQATDAQVDINADPVNG